MTVAIDAKAATVSATPNKLRLLKLAMTLRKLNYGLTGRRLLAGLLCCGDAVVDKGDDVDAVCINSTKVRIDTFWKWKRRGDRLLGV